MHFIPLVSIFSHQSCRKKQKLLMYLVCLQKQAPINSCWRKKCGEARKEKGRAVFQSEELKEISVGSFRAVFEAGAGVVRVSAQQHLGSLWGQPLKANRQME